MGDKDIVILFKIIINVIFKLFLKLVLNWKRLIVNEYIDYMYVSIRYLKQKGVCYLGLFENDFRKKLSLVFLTDIAKVITRTISL